MKKAAVIGSGFGGLALAIRLQAAGIKTTIFEKRDMPGGRAYVYRKDGFTFDAGPTVITDPSALEELFDAAGRNLSDYVELIRVDPFYRLCWEDGYAFDYCSDEDELFRQIAAKNPADVGGYKKFYEFSEAVFEEGYLKLGAVPFLNFWSMIRVAPQLMQLQSFRSVYGRLSDFIKEQSSALSEFESAWSAAIRSRRPRSMRSFMRWKKNGACGFRAAAPARWWRALRNCSPTWAANCG